MNINTAPSRWLVYLEKPLENKNIKSTTSQNEKGDDRHPNNRVKSRKRRGSPKLWVQEFVEGRRGMSHVKCDIRKYESAQSSRLHIGNSTLHLPRN